MKGAAKNLKINVNYRNKSTINVGDFSASIKLIWTSSHLNEWAFSMYVRSDVCRYTYDVILHVIHDILHIMNAEIGLERSTLSFLLTYYNICLQSVFLKTRV